LYAAAESAYVNVLNEEFADVGEPAYVTMHFVEAEIAARAMAAVTSLAGALGLPVNETDVIHNSNKLALHLLPCDAFARVALVGEEVAAFEVEVTRALAAIAAPVALLDPRVEPRGYQLDGFVVTFWTYYPPAAPDRYSPADYADALQRLHAGMRNVAVEAPHFTQRTAEAQRLVTNREDSPALVERDRQFLLSTLHSAGQALQDRVAAEQLLHGEPHPGNLLKTPGGLVFIDFETCCIGPIEFDVAHVPDEVSAHYPGVDQVLLQECRRLVLAMVAAWRWDVHDEFPNGRQHGRNILRLLRDGPPWPTLDALSIE
jgi:phosphotransferase family enzyme